MYSPQYFVRWLCKAAKDLRCGRNAWPSESSHTLTLTSKASACSKLASVSAYTSLAGHGWLRHLAGWTADLPLWMCQPPTSLLVLTGCRNTDCADGGQVLEFIQFRSMYSRCCTICGSLEAVCRVQNYSAMTLAGRKDKAIVWQQTRFMWSSVVYKRCSPADWTFRQTACLKWNAQPHCITPGRTFRTVDHTAAFKVCHNCLYSRAFWECGDEFAKRVYYPCDVAASQWMLGTAALTACPSRRHARKTTGWMAVLPLWMCRPRATSWPWWVTSTARLLLEPSGAFRCVACQHVRSRYVLVKLFKVQSLSMFRAIFAVMSVGSMGYACQLGQRRAWIGGVYVRRHDLLHGCRCWLEHVRRRHFLSLHVRNDNTHSLNLHRMTNQNWRNRKLVTEYKNPITELFTVFVWRMDKHNQNLLRWSLELQQYNFNIVHRAGKDNTVPVGWLAQQVCRPGCQYCDSSLNCSYCC